MINVSMVRSRYLERNTLIVLFTNCWKVLKDRTNSNPHQYLHVGGVKEEEFRLVEQPL